MERVPNPLVIEVKRAPKDLSPDICYLIHTADLAAELYPDFDYLNPRIRDNIYWFETETELDRVIVSRLKNVASEPRVLVNLDDFRPTGVVIFAHEGDRYYLLDGDQLWHADTAILSRLHRKTVDFDYLVDGESIGYDRIRVILKELGLVDEIYTEQNYLSYLSRFGLEHTLLYIYRYMWDHRPEIIYDIDCQYDNPYENIIFVENYLTRQPIYNIDVARCDQYDLKHGRLPARYEYSGLNTTTGRIYCHTTDWFPLPNLAKEKRDVLYASPGHYLVEIDFKSFEFDILCQVLGLPVVDDPHTEMYDRLVGVDVPNKRSIGKTINYALIYGINEGRLADKILNDVPSLGREFREEFIERLRQEEIFILAKELESRLKDENKKGVIQNFFCRNINVRKEHAVLNYYVSSTAADLMYIKFRMVVDMMGDNGSILLENHDSILLHITEDFIASDDFDRLLELMREPVSGIRGRIDFEYGKNWRDLQ